MLDNGPIEKNISNIIYINTSLCHAFFCMGERWEIIPKIDNLSSLGSINEQDKGKGGFINQLIPKGADSLPNKVQPHQLHFDNFES